ncbi:MAG: hypothetical protein PHY29_02375 [Syntrophales bacterium]|nr:hypothetical protein [Syntrophales bacterium]
MKRIFSIQLYLFASFLLLINLFLFPTVLVGRHLNTRIAMTGVSLLPEDGLDGLPDLEDYTDLLPMVWSGFASVVPHLLRQIRSSNIPPGVVCRIYPLHFSRPPPFSIFS